MAAELKRETGMDARLLVGGSGELSVWVDDRLVAEKKSGKFPSPEECVAAVRAALPQQNL